MSDLIPESIKRWLGPALTLIATVLLGMAEWADMGQGFARWALRGVWFITVVSGVFQLGVNPLRIKPGTGKAAGSILLGLLLLGVAASGCKASPAVIATHGTMNAAKLTDSTIAEVHKTGKLDCKQVKLWRTHGRRSVRVAVAGAVVAIKAQKNPDYLGLLKPGACELFRWLDAAAKDAPDKAAKAMAYLGSFKALVCPRGKSAAGIAAILGIILPAAQRVIQWIHSLAGSTDDKLLAEVDAWLADAPDGPTDAICKD